MLTCKALYSTCRDLTIFVKRPLTVQSPVHLCVWRLRRSSELKGVPRDLWLESKGDSRWFHSAILRLAPKLTKINTLKLVPEDLFYFHSASLRALSLFKTIHTLQFTKCVFVSCSDLVRLVLSLPKLQQIHCTEVSWLEEGYHTSLHITQSKDVSLTYLDWKPDVAQHSICSFLEWLLATSSGDIVVYSVALSILSGTRKHLCWVRSSRLVLLTNP